jgi:exonuclease SbcD
MRKQPLKVLHTSDWHLGVQLHTQDRAGEQAKFLAWLRDLVADEGIDALVIAGDVFDNYAPPVQAQELYYNFLASLIELGAARPEVFITAGNHDSAQFLQAPGEVLRALGLHVITSTGSAEHEVFAVNRHDGDPALAVCAVPFPRERDMAVKIAAGAGKTSDKTLEERYRDAVIAHYHDVYALAKANFPDCPVLMTGHLFIEGGAVSDTISERIREAGKLSAVPLAALPKAAYLALGHLHRPQTLRGETLARYAGSPLQMSFSEAGQEKSVTIAEFAGNADAPQLRTVAVPEWQRLTQIRGKPAEIRKRLEELLAAGDSSWIDVQVTEGEGDLFKFWNDLDKAQADPHAAYTILLKEDKREGAAGAGWAAETETDVAELDPLSVFTEKLEQENVTGERRETFIRMFREIDAQVRASSGAQGGGDAD